MRAIISGRRLVGVLGAWSIFVSVALLGCSGPESFEGTELSSKAPAASFRLQNQFDLPVSLSDHTGKVVLLTFLYTNCPDICPIVAGNLRDVHRVLGDDAGDVALVAVSVDPERDSVQAAYAYSEKWQMTHRWDFLVGTKEELSDIWKAYYLDPMVDDHPNNDKVQVQADQQRGAVGALQQQVSERYLVSHSAPVYLIDREGLMQVVFTLPFEPEAMAHDVRLLLR